MKARTKMWAAIGALAVLSPLGLILPALLKSGSAWGEWGTEEIGAQAGYVPAGLRRLAQLWHAPLSDYAFKGWEDKGLGHLSLSYIVSAAAGVAAVVIVVFLLGRLLARNGQE